MTVRRYYASFSYQAQSWNKSRHVATKVEWHPGELYPRVGFIVSNLARSAEGIVAFYNQRGSCEQHIKEGKNAIKWTRLSCRTFAANAVRLTHRLAPRHAPRAGGMNTEPRRGDLLRPAGAVARRLTGTNPRRSCWRRSAPALPSTSSWAHSLTAERPFLNPRLLLDRNYALGLALVCVFGMNVTPMVLLPPPAAACRLSGFADRRCVGGPRPRRGDRVFVALLISKLDPRIGMAIGFGLQVISGLWLTGITLGVDMHILALNSIIQDSRSASSECRWPLPPFALWTTARAR